MRHVLACWAVLVVVALAPPAAAGAHRVRRLGDERSQVWGTDEYEATVTPLGLVRHVKVRGVEVIWQAAALYTSPIPSGAEKGVRTVQGEGTGKRGLTVELPEVTLSEQNGSRVFEFRHLVSNRQVLEGRPLCRVLQTLVLTPTGEIRVTYDCEWLETVRWQTFLILILYDRDDVCRNRPFLSVTDDTVRTGVLEPGPLKPGVRQLRNLALKQFTVRPEMGPVHFMSDGTSRATISWASSIQLSLTPRDMPRRNPVLKGRRERIVYRILLPVSQQ